MNRSTLTTAIAAAVALVAGFAAGNLRTTTDSATPTPPEKNVAPPAEQPDINAPLAAALKTETGAKRWLLLVAAAEKATAKDMPGIIRAAGGDDAATRMLAARWAELDPKHMFATLYAEFLLPDESPVALPNRYTLTDALFTEWAKADPGAAIKALTDVPDFSGLSNMRHSVASQLMKSDVEQGLRAMSEWKIDNYLPDMKSVAAWAAKDPLHAATVAAKYSRGYAGKEVLKHIGKAWATSDPEGGMRFAATLPGESREALGGEILDGWAGRDSAAAARFIAEQKDVGFRNALSQSLVRSWAKRDPAAALAWSDANLTGNARNEAIGDIVKSAAEKSLTTASEIVAGMEAGAAQNRAAASLFETWFKKGKDQREAAFEWLESLPDEESRAIAMERIQWNWMWEDPNGVSDFIAGPHGHLATSNMVHRVAGTLAAKNPEAAMEWAGKLSADRVANARSAVLQSWMQIRPEGAANYARKVPAGEDRDNALSAITGALINGTPERTAAWLHSLPDADQKVQIDRYFATMPAEMKTRIEAAMKQPPK